LGTNKEALPSRKTLSFGLVYLMNEYVDLNFTSVYTHQRNINDALTGVVFGLKPNEQTKIKFDAGLWYKFNESSYYPYLGVSMGNITAGMNYTVYGNKVLSATPRTYEISLIYRHNNSKSYKVPCPKF